jgi:DNA-binding MarR family transcriptional regulator
MSVQDTQEAVRASDLFSHILARTFGLNVISEISGRKVSLAQVQAIRYIWLHQNVLMGDLAAGLGISYPSATNMVKRLEKRGLARRRVNPADRREVEIQLTDQGIALAERMEKERVGRLEAVLNRMSDEQRNGLLNGLRAFVQASIAERAETAAEVCLHCGMLASVDCPVAGCMHGHISP